MSSAAFALGIPAMARSAQSRIWDGRSNSRPIRDRANVCLAFNAEWMFSRVTSVGAAHPCPTRLPEWTERNTTSEIADEPRAIVNGSFRWSVIGRNSIRSIRTPPRTDDVEYQGAPPAPPPESGARGPVGWGEDAQSIINMPAVAFMVRRASSMDRKARQAR